MIDLNDIWMATDGGRKVIEDIYPASKVGFQNKRNFRLRPDDKRPSCTVFRDKSDTFWFIQDKGGSDTKAKNAVTLIQEHKRLDYYQALKYIAENYCNGSITQKEVHHPEPVLEKADKSYDALTIVEKKEISTTALAVFGPDVKAEHCADFNLSQVDHYFTADKGKGSFRISSTEEYPIFYFDYGSFGKLYQPFSKEYRFQWVGEKPANMLFADGKTMKLLRKVMGGEALATDEDDQEGESLLPEVIICTGPSDAINVHAHGYRTAWLNSETAKFTSYDYSLLKKIAKDIYILPDLDKTGVREMLKIATKYLDIKIIWLPDDLTGFKDWKGSTCKDVRDFFKYYRSAKYSSNGYHFKQLVYSALPLRFWDEVIEEDSKGNFKGIKYVINNEQLYRFLSAHGFHTIDSKRNKREFSFVRIIDHVVREIPDEYFVKEINSFLCSFIRNNLEYFKVKLINAIHRSNQVKLASLTNLERVQIDFKAHGHDYDYMFFKNKAVKITPGGPILVNPGEFNKHVFDFKIINHHFILTDPLFEVNYSSAYREKSEKLKKLRPGSDEFLILQAEMASMPEKDKYQLQINRPEFSFLKYVYNTGRMKWREESDPGTSDDRKAEIKSENDINFISKASAFGYCLFRYQESRAAWAVYCMEQKQGELGQHQGGTGKSTFLKYIRNVRRSVLIDTNQASSVDDRHLFSEVVKDDTEFVFFDDVGYNIDLHSFLTKIAGDLTVNPKFIAKYTIPFAESPKKGFTSNHALKNFDDSLRRRIWFLSFGDYYHPENRSKGITRFNMYDEFGKNLVDDYGEDEMNLFYNFAVNCLHTYLKFREKIESDMPDIERRNLHRQMGDDFLTWADEYFTDDKLNVNIDKNSAMENYRSSLTERDRKNVTSQKFKRRLQCYADYYGYIFNPDDLKTGAKEKERDIIRGYNAEGRQVEMIHLRTSVTDASTQGEKPEIPSIIDLSKPPF